MGSAESTPTSGSEDPNIPALLFQMRREARNDQRAGRGTPQVAMIRLDAYDQSAFNATQRYLAGNVHTEEDLINVLENDEVWRCLLNSQGTSVYIFTENSPCASSRSRTSCLEQLISFAKRYSNTNFIVGYQRPYGSRTATDDARTREFINALERYNSTGGIPSNLRFYRMDLTHEDVHHVHDEL